MRMELPLWDQHPYKRKKASPFILYHVRIKQKESHLQTRKRALLGMDLSMP